MEPAARTRRTRFGAFDVDLRSGELHKQGIRLKLQDQPFQVLALLLERAGEVVTREELRQRLWPGDTFVDFDSGLNSAIKKLRDVLADSPDEPHYIQTLPRRGYRFIAPVDNGSAVSPLSVSNLTANGIQIGDSEIQQAETGVAGVPGGISSSYAGSEGEFLPSGPIESLPLGAKTAAKTGREKMRVGMAVGITLTALALGALLLVSAHWTSRKLAIRSVAVLPLKNLTGDPSQEFLADGMTEELIGRLSMIHGLRVISRTSVMQFKDTRVAVPEIAKSLHVDALVEGSIIRNGGRVRVHAQLIRGATDEHVWSETYDRSLGDAMALESEVAQAIAVKVQVTVSGEEHARLVAVRQVSPEVYESYLKGRYYWNKRTGEGLQMASIYFQQAIDRDPAYGKAYSGLADCNSGLAWHGFSSPAEALSKANAAALKAIELDPESAEAHASLALVLHHRLDWPAAETEFKRALQLDARYANAHHWYGDYLSVKGRNDEALLEAKRALELDPLNLMISTWLGLRYYLARNYDRAIEQARNTIDLDPNFAAAHLLLGESYVQMGLHEQGLAELQRAASLSGNSPLYLAQVAVAHASAGRKTEALRIAAQLQKISSKRYVSPYALAQIYAALNDEEQTFKWLQTGYDDRAVWMSYLAVDPVFDRFRSDQRFQGLLRHLNL